MKKNNILLSLFAIVMGVMFFPFLVNAVATSTIKFDSSETSTPEKTEQEETVEVQEKNDFSIYLDKETIAKGYTVSSFQDKLKLSLVPGILNDDTKVETEEIQDEMPLPWNLERISDIYQFEFKNKSAYDDHEPFYIQFSYNKKTNAYKRVFFYDKNYNTWRELPTRDYPKEQFVRSLIHLPYARIAVLADNTRMSSGKASWYAYKGGNFAASPDFPKGSKLRVYNVNNDKFVDVKVNDYGPDRSIFPDRAIDLDKQAFAQIASIGEGVIDISIKPLQIEADDRGQVLGISEKGAGVKPKINSRAALVINEDTEEVVIEKNSQEIMPLASLTKLVAIKTFLDMDIDLNKKITYQKKDEIYNYEYCKPWESSKIRLEEGDVVTAKDFLYASLVGSANNAVESLVRGSGLDRNEFINRMNNLVKKWGTEKTKFVEPTGLSSENVTTAQEYAIITKEIFAEPLIKDISTTGSYELEILNKDKSITIRNTNKFIRNDLFARTNNLEITGSKTGYLDQALYCLMTRATGPEGENLIVVSLGASSRNDSLEEVKDLIKYGINSI